MLSALPIVFTGFTGSWMVIAVNAWMNHPGGFRLVRGEAVDIHPFHALFGNSYLWHELVHMYLAGYIVTGFVVAGAYAIARLRGRWGRYERTALVVPLTIAALASPVQLLVGDWAARDVAESQATKLAALEGLGRTERGAPIHVLGWYQDGRMRFGIGIPKMLSVLAFHDPNARVAGPRRGPARRAPAGQRRAHLLPDHGRHRDAAGGAGRGRALSARAPTSAARVALVLLRPGGSPARLRSLRSSAAGS